MRATLKILMAIVVVWPAAPRVHAVDFIHGTDVSCLPQVEAGGGVFRDDGDPTDCLTILKAHGVNTARLRLWHAPGDGHSGLPEVLALAARAQAAGLDLLLDLHYSDTWADPGHQAKPAAWASLPLPALRDSVRAYTREVMIAFRSQGLSPAIVQLGNEITVGLLWDDGRVGGSFDTPAQWENLAGLLQAAASGVAEAFPTGPRPEVMIHIDRGGDNAGARWFLDHLMSRGVAFDLIGLSYYPWWHGSLADLEANLADLAPRYSKDIIVVETAYPWTLGWFDDMHNPVGLPEQLLPGYPATPRGQADFLNAVLALVRAAPGGHGRGVFWWEPEWIAAPGLGSSWENLTLFDEQGQVLPALDAFAPAAAAAPAPPRTGLRLAPNPFQTETVVSWAGSPDMAGRVAVYDLGGRRLAGGELVDGEASWVWRPVHPAAGVYFFRVNAAGRIWTTRATLVP